jgi:hypothetical protein
MWLTTYEYDAQHRLQRIVSGGSLYATYDAWDDVGRPTHFVLAGPCGGVASTLSYGDRTLVADVPSGSCKQHVTTTYDADRILTNIDYGDGTTATQTTTGRATVCR